MRDIFPGKEYFLKNPDGFLMTHLFASGSIQNRLITLVNQEAELIPVSLHIAPMKLIHSFGRCVVVIVQFPAELPGTSITMVSRSSLDSLAARSAINYKEFMLQLNEPISTNLSQLISKADTTVQVSCKYAEVSTYPVKGNEYCLWVKYHCEVPGSVSFFMMQCITNELLFSLYRYFLGTEVSPDVAAHEDKLLAHVRSLNKRYQEKLLDTISATEEGRVDLGGTGALQGALVRFNLEELRLANDRTIRAILENVSRKHFPLKKFVFALSGMSEDLCGRFMHNMSRNRRTEVRDGLLLWNGSDDEIIQAQRDLVWVIIDLIESREIKVNKRLQTSLEAIIHAMDAALKKSAEAYIKSHRFDVSVAAINDVLFQVLLRRVPRKILIAALSVVQEDTNKKISVNMTPNALKVLSEDIEHWKRKIEDKTEKITAATAQQRIVRLAIKLKKEFDKSAF